MKMQDSQDCGSDSSALNRSLYYPWICLVSIIIGGLFSTIVIIVLYSSRNISGAVFSEYAGPQSQLTDAISSEQFRTALLISVSFAIPMFFDSILDCAYPITYQEERVLWYSKVLFMIAATIPNFILLTSNFGTLTEDLYIIFFYLYRTSVVGFTMAYTSQIALKYGMNDISRGCVLIVILGTSAYCLKSISNFAMTPVVSFLTNSASALLVISHLLIYRGVHQWYVTAHSAGESVSYCEIVILVKLLSAITCNLLFTVAAFYHSAFDFRNSSSSCICTYLYIQMLFIIIVMTIPGRISRLEVNCATRAMKERQAFIRYISHEIRTPLNTVFLGLEFVTSALKRIPSRIGDDSIRPVMDTVEDICSSCEIAMSILNDLLTFDKLDGGKMALELDYVNCCNFIYSLSKPFNVNARDKNIAFHVNFMNLSPDFIENAHIRVDSSKMGQVVRNLISNALKFTPDHGTVTLMLSHLKIDNFGDCVNFQTEVKEPMLLLPEEKNHGLRDVLRLEVSDTGAGISAANQTKLFGEYVQFNANKLQQGNGSGLGLWISKGITELHGGCIGAHSEGEGKGSTFHLELPVTFLAKEGKSRTVSASVSSHSTPAGAYMLGDSSGICSRTTAPGSDLDGDIGEDIFMDRIGLKEPTTESLTAGVMSHLRRLHSINHSAVLRSLQHQGISRNEAKEWKHRSGGDPGDADSVEVEGDEFNMDMNSEYDADEMDRSEEDKIGAMQKMMGVYSGSSSVSSKSSISRDRSAAYGMSDSSSLAATGSGTNTGAGNVSDPSLLSRKSSADFLSNVHPLITTSIPFAQSMNCSRNSMSISSSRFQSRYPSVSNTPRCTTPPHASSGISTPSLTGHNTPHYSSQRVSPAGSGERCFSLACAPFTVYLNSFRSQLHHMTLHFTHHPSACPSPFIVIHSNSAGAVFTGIFFSVLEPI